LRLLLALQWTHPGKHLLFMGGEIAQREEWNPSGALSWDVLGLAPHGGVQKLVADLNELYRASPELYELDSSPDGFRWIDFADFAHTVVSFRRISGDGREMVCVFNLTPVPRPGYRLGVPAPGRYAELINTDSRHYGGSGTGNLGGVDSDDIPWHGLDSSVELFLPPLACILLRLR
ncbi:alpha amylase C-terminal domain-containing protein, partial [Candidatus Fermentibacterales bacterium]|nr:alpha amylase C-terminal domain-containing protein [Candidatus Fermentibacterales bacterium]